MTPKNKAVIWKSIFIATLFVNAQANASLFGPKNFEDCILDGMKGVNNDTAANAVIYSCRQKFPNTSNTSPMEINNIGQRVCRIYWIGTGFIKDRKEKRKGFIQYSIVYESTQIKYLASIPERMEAELEKGDGGINKQLLKLLENNMFSIRDACNL